MIAAIFKKYPKDEELYLHGCYNCNTSNDNKKIVEVCKRLKHLQGCEIVIKKMKGTI